MRQRTLEPEVNLRKCEIDRCEQAYQQFKEKDGMISMWNIRKALRSINVNPIEERIFEVAEQLDDCNGIDLHTLKVIVTNHKKKDPEHDIETIAAFVALGGNEDRTGHLQTEILQAAFTNFGLTSGLETMLAEVDEDGNGTIDFYEFCQLVDSDFLQEKKKAAKKKAEEEELKMKELERKMYKPTIVIRTTKSPGTPTTPMRLSTPTNRTNLTIPGFHSKLSSPVSPLRRKSLAFPGSPMRSYNLENM
jgi:Ca2+-binding EF-hand superfamily protein